MHIESYLKYLQFEKRFSPHTIRAYTDDLHQFNSFVQLSTDSNNQDLAIIDHSIIRKWIIHLYNKNISSQSINRKISGLKKFYKYLVSEQTIEINPFDKIISPKASKKLPEFIKQSEIIKLFDQIKFADNFKGQRDKLILELLYGSGMRLSELINLKESDINSIDSTIKVLGKRNKERIIPLPEYLIELINKYIQVKNSKLLDNDYLLVTEKGKKAYPKLIYRVVTGYLGLVSTNDSKSPHTLRHTYATHLLNNGADLNAIKELLGHANLSATQIYTHNTFKKLNRIYKQAHPRA
jgi:integrase/recombinase XerC